MNNKREERCILINDYLYNNPKIFSNGESDFLINKLDNFLHKLEPFERPDMYAIYNQELLIIEHFQFDATKSNSKKKNGFEIENMEKKNRIDSSHKKHMNVNELEMYLNAKTHHIILIIFLMFLISIIKKYQIMIHQ